MVTDKQKSLRVLVQATSGGYYNGLRDVGNKFHIGSEDEFSERWMTKKVDKDAPISEGTDDAQAEKLDEVQGELDKAKAKIEQLEKENQTAPAPAPAPKIAPVPTLE